MAERSKTIERLTMYTDAIMAVVATLLVLGIEVPEDHVFSSDGLTSFLYKIRHDIGAYALSFLIVTSYWMQHHAIFLFLRQANRTFTWLNFVFLFFVTLIPFGAKLLSVYRHDSQVVVIYGVLQALCGASLGLMWWYASTQRPLIETGLDAGALRSLTTRILLGPALNLLAVAISLVSVPPALCIFIIVPLLNLSHRKVDRALLEQFEHGA